MNPTDVPDALTVERASAVVQMAASLRAEGLAVSASADAISAALGAW